MKQRRAEKMVQYADAADAFSMAKELGYTG